MWVVRPNHIKGKHLISYTHLTLKEHYVIYHLQLCRLSIREIARRLQRAHTTISREIQRNRRLVSSVAYVDEFAYSQALLRRKQARHHRRQANKHLVKHIYQRLQAHWSPDVFVAKLAQDYPDNYQMRVSIETIYRWVYQEAAHGGELYQCLPRCHRKRRRQHRYGAGRGLIPGRVSIHLRPDTVIQKQRYGDWEGDSVEGAKGTGLITTHVERKSRYLIAGKLANKTATTTTKVTCAAFKRIPKALRKTLT